MNVSGMSNPTSMYVDPVSREVLGPSLPRKISGNPGWRGVPAWVEYIPYVGYREITNPERIRKIVYERYLKKNVKTSSFTYNIDHEEETY